VRPAEADGPTQVAHHDSGDQNLNPSEKDSGGPGYFFRDGQEFKAALAEVRAIFCE
jgi:hypothetical protein